MKKFDFKAIDWKKVAKEYSIITFGLILAAVGIEYFYVPNNLAAGGVSGLAIVVNYFVPFLTPSVFCFFVNVILFILAFFLIGKDFGIKTLYGTYGLIFIMWFIEKFLNPTALTNDLMLASIFGPGIIAFGMAIAFNANASTGGTDIIAKILNKYTTFNIGVSLIIIDILVTISAAIVFGVDTGFYAFLCVIFNGFLIDKFIAMFNKTKQVTVISDKNDEISKFIIETLDRKCTYFKGASANTGKPKEIIYAIVKQKELDRLKEFIDKIDEDAFITIGQVDEVIGSGFPKLEGL